MITELEKLFRRLVREIVDRQPDRVHRPMTVGEVTETFLPYRVARRTLEVHAADEYETLLVRLFAGEGNMVHLHDTTTRARFAEQAAASLPDLDILRREAGAPFDFWTEALAYALGPGDRAYAPPEEDDDYDEPDDVADGGDDGADGGGGQAGSDPGGRRSGWAAAAAAAAVDDAAEPDDPFGVPITGGAPMASLDARLPVPSAEGSRCGYCGGLLPNDRTVNFCPHCGQSQTGARCPECRNDVEEGWRHCVTCGFPLGPA